MIESQVAAQSQRHEAVHDCWINDEIADNTFKDSRLARRLKVLIDQLAVSVRRVPFLRGSDAPGSIRGVAHHDGVHSTRTSAHRHGTSQRSPQGHQAQTQRGLQTQTRQAGRRGRRLGRGHRADARHQCQLAVQVAPRTV